MIALDAFTAALPPDGRRYAADFLRIAETSGESPFILAAIVERESGYGNAVGFAPKGPGGKGDHGFGHGLFQIDSRTHQVFLAKVDVDGIPLWKKPYDAGLYAAKLLQDARLFFQTPSVLGKVVIGAKWCAISRDSYGFTVRPGSYPDLRPLTGPALDRAMLASYNAGVENVVRTLAAGFPADARTTGKDYSADVLRRAARISSRMSTLGETGVG